MIRNRKGDPIYFIAREEMDRIIEKTIAMIYASKEDRAYRKSLRKKISQKTWDFLPQRWGRKHRKKKKGSISIWDQVFTKKEKIPVVKKRPVCVCEDIVNHFLYCKSGGPFFPKKVVLEKAA